MPTGGVVYRVLAAPGDVPLEPHELGGQPGEVQVFDPTGIGGTRQLLVEGDPAGGDRARQAKPRRTAGAAAPGAGRSRCGSGSFGLAAGRALDLARESFPTGGSRSNPEYRRAYNML